MGSVKSSMLTWGHSFKESTKLVWLLSAPAWAEVTKAMQEVPGLLTSDVAQIHKDLTQARLKHDNKVPQTLLKYLDEWQPFSKDTHELCSLSSGVIVDVSVNVDSTKDVGAKNLASMKGVSVAKYKFSKKKPGEHFKHLQYMCLLLMRRLKSTLNRCIASCYWHWEYWATQAFPTYPPCLIPSF